MRFTVLEKYFRGEVVVRLLSTYKHLLMVLMLFYTMDVFCAESRLVVVVNAQNVVKSLTKNEVIDIYMGRFQSFPDGLIASPLDLPISTKLRTQFYRQLVNQSEKRIQSYWSRLLFSGRATPPLKLDDISLISNYVAQNKSAIAYLPENLITNKMRVVYAFQ